MGTFNYLLPILLRPPNPTKTLYPLSTLNYSQLLKHQWSSHLQLSALFFLLLNFYSCFITKTNQNVTSLYHFSHPLLQSKLTAPTCWKFVWINYPQSEVLNVIIAPAFESSQHFAYILFTVLNYITWSLSLSISLHRLQGQRPGLICCPRTWHSPSLTVLQHTFHKSIKQSKSFSSSHSDTWNQKPTFNYCILKTNFP